MKNVGNKLSREDRTKLKATYLTNKDKTKERADKSLFFEYGLVVHIIINILYRATTTNEITLSNEQLRDLVSDMNYCKAKGLWDSAEEKKVLEQCKKDYEKRKLLRRMSTADQLQYLDMQLDSIGIKL